MSYDIPGVSMKSVSNTSRGGSQRGAGSVVMCVENDASVIENPLELGGGLCGLMRRKVRLATNVDLIECAEEPVEADAGQGEVEARRSLERLNRRRAIMNVQ